MTRTEELRERLHDAARDLKLNLQTVLGDGTLSPAQRWGVALACAIACRNSELRDAIAEDAKAHAPAEVLDDARAAAALMGMNNVYYRFRHFAGAEYESIPARLRMNRIARPASSKLDFELMCLAVSAINGCEVCVKSHEKNVREHGLSPEQVNDAVRIAATMHGVAAALAI